MSIPFDDLDALKALVSDEYGPFAAPIEITQSMVDTFAEVTMDPQWIHNDPERCKTDSPFGVPVAHGFLLVSLLTKLGEGVDAPVTGYSYVLNYGADRVRFVSPVPVGSWIHARRRVVHVRKKGPGGTQLTTDTEVYVVGSDKPALVYRALILFMP